MTVKELKQELENWDDDVIRQVNMRFAGSIYDFSKDKYKYAK